MNRVGEFHKVSFGQFKVAYTDICGGCNEAEIKSIYDEIKTPMRATTGSAGYDIISPYAVKLAPGESAKIPTGIRAEIKNGWFLMILPRSSFGFKYRMQLDNTAAIIDADYFFSDNEGHIFIKVTNDNKAGKELVIQSGQAFAQGIFLPFGITDSDNVKSIRNGGIGSTDT